MFVGVLQLTLVFDVSFVILRVGHLVQGTADDRLRLGVFGHHDRFESVFARGDVAILADEVGVTGTLHQKLGHGRVVVISVGQVTVGAAFGFVNPRGTVVGFVGPTGATANGVRHVGAERDARHAVAADGLLLRVDGFAVGVVTGHVDRTAAACRPDAIAGHVAVACQHEDVVTQGLEVVTGSVSRHVTGEVQLGRFDVGFLRKVTAETRRIPRTVTSNAGDLAILVGTLRKIVLRRAAPSQGTVEVQSHAFGRVGSNVVVGATGTHRVGGLGDFPPQIGFDGAALDQFRFLSRFAKDFEAFGAESGPQCQQVGAALGSRRAGRGQSGRGAGSKLGFHFFDQGSIRRAVTIDALDLDRRADLVVQNRIPVTVVVVMTVAAVHAFF